MTQNIQQKKSGVGPDWIAKSSLYVLFV